MPDGKEVELVQNAVDEISEIERKQHGDLVTRHIDFLTEVLSAEQIGHGRSLPAACPGAISEPTARRREKSGGMFPCSYEAVGNSRLEQDDDCTCGDPLRGINDPLDAVAAVILGSDDRSGSHRYFDHEWRSVVAKLRGLSGSWVEISSLSSNELREKIDQSTTRVGVEESRIQRLESALDYIQSHRYIDSTTLRGLPTVTYERLAQFLEGSPGIDERDAWWLVLTAFDKPVWPADPAIDTMLADFGLLDPAELSKDRVRRKNIEDRLTDRQIPALHRAIAGHALKEGPSFCGDDCEIRKFSLLYRDARQGNPKDGPRVVDLFSGAGGLSHGFTIEGSEIALAVDNDQYASDTYRLNHPEIPHERVKNSDIESLLDGDSNDGLPDDVDLIIGGPPCQSLSQAGYRARLANDTNYSILEDPRTHLYRSYVEMVDRLDPSIILMENVEGIINEVGDSEIRVLDQIEEEIEERGYVCHSELLDSSEFGIPQERERVFLIGLKPGLAPNDDVVQRVFDTLEARAPNSTFSLRDGLAGLPRLRRGEGGNALPERKAGRLGEYVSGYQLHGRTRISFNHLAREHPMEKDRELFDSVMEPGDTGWEVKYEKGRDDLIEYDVGTEENPRFMDKYRMIHWDRPAPTVVAHLAKDANNFIIPDYYSHVRPDPERVDSRRNRGITPREAARLQSFPDDFIFLGPYTSQFRQIGNAVPPVLGQQLASVLIDVLDMDANHSKQKAATTNGRAVGD